MLTAASAASSAVVVVWNPLASNSLRAALIILSRGRSEEHTSELQSLVRISYAVFCLKNKIRKQTIRKSASIDQMQKIITHAQNNNSNKKKEQQMQTTRI